MVSYPVLREVLYMYVTAKLAGLAPCKHQSDCYVCKFCCNIEYTNPTPSPFIYSALLLLLSSPRSPSARLFLPARRFLLSSVWARFARRLPSSLPSGSRIPYSERYRNLEV